MELNFGQIEESVKASWAATNIYSVKNESQKPKYYVLEMFPYPSGAGLHVGHPLGYIASDIFARYKRHKGFNVLHPMGYDAFGLPAEQYAIETGQHPSVTTQKNIIRYREQLDKIGLSYDWSRQVKTSDPGYYKWTQWIFLQIFNSWYNTQTHKAENISTLIIHFETLGTNHLKNLPKSVKPFTPEDWKLFTEKEQADILMQFRLGYLDLAEVNWCEALGTVLANDEVVNGVSERGGHKVEKKKMRQWFLRITAYADRLLEGLNKLDWSPAMKDMQRNWIGKSEGAIINFKVAQNNSTIEVFTTRPDTIFGCSFMVLAPEHQLIESITTADKNDEVAAYISYVKSRSDVDRMAEKKISGCFTGAYALHPFTHQPIPVWISEYVLAGYGTGAIMAVPAGDARDYAFAKYMGLPIPNIFEGVDIDTQCYEDKDALLINSDFLNGLNCQAAGIAVISQLEQAKIGTQKINYKMRDAGFSRQRYWGEPFPIYYENGIAKALPETDLPIELPHVDTYSPGPNGQGPLANLESWTSKNLETNTMPGYAGSSWYFLRYMDPHNPTEFVSQEAMKYWGAVDFYNGGSEHAVGHLLYSRLWTKILFDLGHINFDEPFIKMVNQGMIQGSSRIAYRLSGTNKFISKNLISNQLVDEIKVDVNMVDGELLQIEAFRKWRPEFNHADFELENGKYICGSLVEKMSKSKYNVVNPDEIIAQYGADTFRMYEMFLGPIEVSKPWDTKGIEGVSRFIKKFWNLYVGNDQLNLSAAEPTLAELKILHKTIKKIDEDIQKLAYNTCVSQLMICINELQALKCNKQLILEPLLIILNPFAPFITEHLWQAIGHKTPLIDEPFPIHDNSYLVENTFTYPIAINGKTRHSISFALDAQSSEIESIVLADENVLKYTEGKKPKKFILVKGRMINIVI